MQYSRPSLKIIFQGNFKVDSKDYLEENLPLTHECLIIQIFFKEGFSNDT